MEGCVHHSGVQKEIDAITKKYDRLCDKIDNINTNVNRILGGVVIACVLLVINMVTNVV